MANKTASKKVSAKKSVKATKPVERINKSLFIVKEVKTNPRREGTFGHDSFAKIKNGMTVEQFVEKGGRLKDLHWDLRHGYLKLAARKAS